MPAIVESRRDLETRLQVKALKDPEFRQALIANPQQVITDELGMGFPGALDIEVVEETSDTLYIVVPPQIPDDMDELTDEQLENVAGGATPLAVTTVLLAAWLGTVTKQTDNW